MNNIKKICLLLIVVFFVTACSNNKIYQQYEELAKFQWERSKVLNYTMPIKDNSKNYFLGSSLRFLASVAHSSIKINFKMTAPSGKVELVKAYEIKIRNEKGIDGSVMGDIADVDKPLEESIKFAEKGDYKVEITHNMNAIEILNGVQSVGIFLEDKDKDKKK